MVEQALVHRPVAWRTGLALTLGAALFAVRPYTSLDPDSAPLLLAGIYVALFAVSTGPAVRPGERILSPSIAAAAGIAAALAIRLMMQPVVPPDPRLVVAVLGVMAAVAEEAFFRRLAYSALQRWGTVVAVAGTAILFSVMHYPSYGFAALPLDFGAGLLFAWQRWASGSWVAPAVTHAFANVLSSI